MRTMQKERRQKEYLNELRKERAAEAKRATLANEALKQIAKCLTHIAEEDLTTAEKQIVKVLVQAGVLKFERVGANDFSGGQNVVRPAW